MFAVSLCALIQPDARLKATAPDNPPSCLFLPLLCRFASDRTARWDSRRRWVPGKSLLNGVTWLQRWSAVNRRASGLDGVD